MRSVPVNQDSGLVIMVEGVTGYMRPAIHQQDLFARASRQAFGQHTA
jgi:hypothetical protein